MSYCRQRWQVRAGIENIVKANDGHLVGYTPSGCAQYLYRAKTRQIVAGEHGGEWRSRYEDLLHRCATILAAMFTVSDQALVFFQPEGSQGFPISRQTLSAVSTATRLARDEGNAPMSMLHQMLERLPKAAGVIDGDGGSRLFGGRQHDRVTGVDQILHILELHLR